MQLTGRVPALGVGRDAGSVLLAAPRAWLGHLRVSAPGVRQPRGADGPGGSAHGVPGGAGRLGPYGAPCVQTGGRWAAGRSGGTGTRHRAWAGRGSLWAGLRPDAVRDSRAPGLPVVCPSMCTCPQGLGLSHVSLCVVSVEPELVLADRCVAVLPVRAEGGSPHGRRRPCLGCCEWASVGRTPRVPKASRGRGFASVSDSPAPRPGHVRSRSASGHPGPSHPLVRELSASHASLYGDLSFVCIYSHKFSHFLDTKHFALE